VAGVIGVAWQANVANEERRRAEASAADLRQLSNSLLWTGTPPPLSQCRRSHL